MLGGESGEGSFPVHRHLVVRDLGCWGVESKLLVFLLRATIGFMKDSELGGVRAESLVSSLLLAQCVNFGESVALSWTQVIPSVSVSSLTFCGIGFEITKGACRGWDAGWDSQQSPL